MLLSNYTVAEENVGNDEDEEMGRKLAKEGFTWIIRLCEVYIWWDFKDIISELLFEVSLR